MKKVVLTAALAVGLAAGILLPALAANDGDVVIGQEVVLRIRFEAGGKSIKERADLVTVRLNELLGSQPFVPDDVKVGVQNKEYVVMVGETVIITADKNTADFNKTTPEKLAEIWAENLRRIVPKAKAEPK